MVSRFKKILPVFCLLIGFVVLSILAAKPAQAAAFFQAANVCEYLKAAFDFAIIAAGIITVIVIMIAGTIYMFSGGDQGRMTTAKTTISGSITGLVLTFFAWALFSLLNPYLLTCKLPPKLELPGVIDVDICNTIPKYESKEACDAVPVDFTASCKENTKGEWCRSACGYNTAGIAENFIGTCFGPNHCAWFTSEALKYTGCSFGSAGVPTLQEQLSSDSSGFQGYNYENSPDLVGRDDILIWGSATDDGLAFQHAGIASSGSQTIESGGGGFGDCQSEGDCPRENSEAVGTTLCLYCEKVPEEGPSTGKYARQGQGTNQCVHHQGIRAPINFFRPRYKIEQEENQAQNP